MQQNPAHWLMLYTTNMSRHGQCYNHYHLQANVLGSVGLTLWTLCRSLLSLLHLSTVSEMHWLTVCTSMLLCLHIIRLIYRSTGLYVSSHYKPHGPIGAVPISRFYSPLPDTSSRCKATDTGLVYRAACLFTPQLSPVPNYTAWWQRHIGVGNSPGVFTP